MQNCECPHCHKATITPWQKLFVGVGRGVTCPSCSNELVISWKSLWIVAGLENERALVRGPCGNGLVANQIHSVGGEIEMTDWP